ncbi:MAG: phage terminase large subunit [Devosia sp.]
MSHPVDLAPLDPGTKRATLDALLRKDLASFIGKAHSIITPGVPFIPNWHMEAIAHRLMAMKDGKIRRLVITMPPRSMKSTSANIAYSAWMLGHCPTLNITAVSYGDSLSTKFSVDTRHLMQHPVYRRLFPKAQLARTKETELTTRAGGSRLATSVGGAVTGRGADLIIIDDPHKAEEAGSPAALARTREWYANTLVSRLNDMTTGRILLIMQRLHVDDLAGHVLEQGGWDHLCLPAIADTDETVPLGGDRVHHRAVGDLLQPRRDSPQALNDRQAEIGTGLFQAQYQQQPVPPGGNLVEWRWFTHFTPPFVPADGDLIIQSWDTAGAENDNADYSVGITLVKRKELFFVIDVVRTRLTYPYLKRAIVDVKTRHNAKYCVIEKAGIGQGLIDDLRAEGHSVRGHLPKGHKTTRLEYELPVIEAGRVVLPSDAPWLNDFRDELLAFPKGRHDDQVDALSQGLYWLRTLGTRTVRWGGIRGAH